MKTWIVGLVSAVALSIGVMEPANAQVSVGIPGTGIRIEWGDPYYYNRDYYTTYPSYNTYYYNRYPNQNRSYYNRYNTGFTVNRNGRLFLNGRAYTGWRGNVYYRNGWISRW